MNKKWINRTSHISQWTGSFVHRRTRYWELVRLLEVREGEGGGREFLVQWAGEDRNGDPWPNDWQPEKNVTADAICEFEFSCAVMNDLQLNGLDVRPLLSLARKKIASALLACKQKEVASMHNIPLDFLAHEKLCRAFFALAARPGRVPPGGEPAVYTVHAMPHKTGRHICLRCAQVHDQCQPRRSSGGQAEVPNLEPQIEFSVGIFSHERWKR